MEELVVRADTGSQIGLGHIMRCIALSQAWKDAGGHVIFITSCQNKGLLQRLKDEGFEVHPLIQSSSDSDKWVYMKTLLAHHPDTWTVLDGYHFNETDQQQIKEMGHRLLVIDDMAHLKHYYSDLVLNQNLHAQQFHYSCEPNTQLLLGSSYVLLRKEFLNWKGRKRESSNTPHRVLVTLGGIDPANHTLTIIESLQKIAVPGMEVIVIVGANNQHVQKLKEAITSSHPSIRLVHDPKSMPELMDWADLAICAGGTTVWEFLFLGVPVLILTLADNQVSNATAVAQQQVGKSLGWATDMNTTTITDALNHFLTDASLSAKMSNNARQIVDGKGTKRVIASMQELKVCK